VVDATDYERMKLFLGHVTTTRMRIPCDSPIHPLNVLVEVEAKFGRSKAKSGLQMAINDIVEELARLQSHEVSARDIELSRLGAMTLSEARAHFSRALKRIIRRNCIRDDEEYYLVRNAVDFLNSEDSVRCAPMLAAFEHFHSRPN
jgi:hypothetical protein